MANDLPALLRDGPYLRDGNRTREIMDDGAAEIERLRAQIAAVPTSPDVARSDPSASAQQAAPVAWCLTLGAVRTFAAELVRGAEATGDDEDELILEVRSPGTVADDDGALNVRHILALSLAEYPEEGVYPIDPTDPIGGRVDAAPAPSASPVALTVTDDEWRASKDLDNHSAPIIGGASHGNS